MIHDFPLVDPRDTLPTEDPGKFPVPMAILANTPMCLRVIPVRVKHPFRVLSSNRAPSTDDVASADYRVGVLLPAYQLSGDEMVVQNPVEFAFQYTLLVGHSVHTDPRPR